MNLRSLVIPLGIAAYTLILVTLLSGLLKVRLKWHKRLAFSSVVLASLHAGLVIYLKYFAR